MNVKINRHLIINLVIVIALVLLAVWIMNNTYWAETSVPKSLSGEAATNPFYAAEKLTEQLGAKAEWKHLLGDSLDQHAIVVMSNWNWDVIEQRRDIIQKWVEAGGRLVLDASLITAGDGFADWSGLKFTSIPEKDNADEEQENKPSPRDNNSKKQKALWTVNLSEDDCESLPLVISGEAQRLGSTSSTLSLCNIFHGRFITSGSKVNWGLRDDDGWQVAQVNIGKGSVTLFNALPYQYRGVLLGDQALMFARITQLKRGDQVFFIMDEEGVPLLKLIWRYGSPAVMLGLLLVAIVLWRNGMRFGPMAAVSETARRSLSEQISGTGKFILQFNGDKVLHAATARALTDAARIHIAHYERMDAAAKTEALAKTTGISADELQTAIHYQGSRRASDLKHAIAIMESARRHLLDQKANQVSNHSSASSSGRSHAS